MQKDQSQNTVFNVDYGRTELGPRGQYGPMMSYCLHSKKCERLCIDSINIYSLYIYINRNKIILIIHFIYNIQFVYIYIYLYTYAVCMCAKYTDMYMVSGSSFLRCLSGASLQGECGALARACRLGWQLARHGGDKLNSAMSTMGISLGNNQPYMYIYNYISYI